MVSHFTIPENHPSLAGHFPGNPIVPGVVILDKVIGAIKDRWSEVEVTGIKTVKFIKPLRAGQMVTLTIHKDDMRIIMFTCECDDKVFAAGQCSVFDKDVT